MARNPGELVFASRQALFPFLLPCEVNVLQYGPPSLTVSLTFVRLRLKTLILVG